MSKRSAELFVEDILESCHKIMEYTIKETYLSQLINNLEGLFEIT